MQQRAERNKITEASRLLAQAADDLTSSGGRAGLYACPVRAAIDAVRCIVEHLELSRNAHGGLVAACELALEGDQASALGLGTRLSDDVRAAMKNAVEKADGI